MLNIALSRIQTKYKIIQIRLIHYSTSLPDPSSPIGKKKALVTWSLINSPYFTNKGTEDVLKFKTCGLVIGGTL